MKRWLLAVSAGSLLLGACGDPPVSPEPPARSIDVELRQSMAIWGPIPIGTMAAQDPAQVALGRALFFDRILSGNRDVSCATCHHPATALGDGRTLPIGTGGTGTGATRTLGAAREFVPRTAPSLLNSGLGAFYMLWDGRLSSFGGQPVLHGNPPVHSGAPNILAAQVLLAVLDRREMRGEPGDLDVFGNPNELALIADDRQAEALTATMQRLMTIPEYREMFNAAFPGIASTHPDFMFAARALAAFQREAFTRTRSPFDRYLERDDAALSPEEKRGALLFFGNRARCASCHVGPLLGGQGFANVGVPQIGPGVGREAPLDLGRGELLDHDGYRFAFRIPPLRNVELTAPYMHNGAYRTLEDVVRHYNDVPHALRNYDPTQLDEAVRPLHRGDETTVNRVLATLDPRLRVSLGLTETEIRDLVAFLKSLTDPAARDLRSLVPASVPSGLPVDG